VTSALLSARPISSDWLAGRVVRIGMLRYGKKVSFREVFKPQSAQGK
jgi:hypothetical protein